MEQFEEMEEMEKTKEPEEKEIELLEEINRRGWGTGEDRWAGVSGGDGKNWS